MKAVIPDEMIEKKILLIRGEKVMLDADLAELYGVETKMLVRAVKRNIDRFPSDFMIQLNKEQFENLRFQFGTSSRWGGRRLNSERAIQVNIAIIRVFVKFREILSTHKELAHKLAELERKIERHDEEIKIVFDAIRQLMTQPEPKEKKIGFRVRERGARYRTSTRRDT